MRSLSGDPTDLLLALRRMDHILCTRADALRQMLPAEEGEFRGVFISEREFEELLARPFGQTRMEKLSPQQRSSSEPPSVILSDSAWGHLVRAFGLSSFEADVLLLCLLPEIDLKYERIYAYLQDDLTRKRPCVQLCLDILCSDLSARIQARRAFLPDAPLLKGRLVTRQSADDGTRSLLASSLHAAPDVVSHLLNPSDCVGPASHTGLRAEHLLSRLALPEKLDREATRLAQISPPPNLWIQMIGHDTWTARRVAEAVATAWGLSLLEIDPAQLPRDRGPLSDVIGDARRDALLHQAAIFVLPMEDRPPNGDGAPVSPSGKLDVMLDELSCHPLPIFWHTGPNSVALSQGTHKGMIARLECTRPSYKRRLVLWREALNRAALEQDASLEALASRYRLDGQQIVDAARAAAHRAWQREMPRTQGPERESQSVPHVNFEDLAWAARQASSAQLGQLARHITAHHSWDDLVLPGDRIAQLQEICDQFKYRHRVYDEWGFGSKDGLGHGLSALFAGPSGTGKTMAAGIMAAELALDLYKIDLSGVVSKYIGETEKNLERIFGLAQDSNAILLFDEADALFGKRSETKDAHDRYANIEVSYLLQKIEEYDGIVLLTSNLRQNLDEAFLRRLQFTVEFPLPDEAARLEIWRRLLPDQAPVASDVDLCHMAERFRLSGGSIRNVAVNAAFLAAREETLLAPSPEISMAHLLWATRREHQKLGKLVDDDQFPELIRLREMNVG